MQRITAHQARDMARNAPVAVARFEAVMKVIYDRIAEAATKVGHRSELNYIFDHLNVEERVNDQFKQRIIAQLTEDGYTYKHVASQDPGHPADRPNDYIRW